MKSDTNLYANHKTIIEYNIGADPNKNASKRYNPQTASIILILSLNKNPFPIK